MPAATGDSFTILANSTADASAGRRPAAFGLAALWNMIRLAAERADAYRRLQDLDDRTLKDIGMHRTEISSVLHYDLHDPSRRVR